MGAAPSETRNSRIAKAKSEASVRPTRRSILQQENKITLKRNAEADAVAVVSSSSSRRKISERGPLRGSPERVEDSSEESSSGEFLVKALADRKFKERCLERKAERGRVRGERERRGLVLGTDNPTPKPSSSRRWQNKSLEEKEQREQENLRSVEEEQQWSSWDPVADPSALRPHPPNHPPPSTDPLRSFFDARPGQEHPASAIVPSQSSRLVS